MTHERMEWAFADFISMWDALASSPDDRPRGNFMFAMCAYLIAGALVANYGIGAVRSALMNRCRAYINLEALLTYLSNFPEIYSDANLGGIDVLITGATSRFGSRAEEHMTLSEKGLLFCPDCFVADLKAVHYSLSEVHA